MSAEVIEFPTDGLARNIQRHLVELFAKMAELGMTPKEQWALLEQCMRDMGLVQIDGVWRMPDAT